MCGESLKPIIASDQSDREKLTLSEEKGVAKLSNAYWIAKHLKFREFLDKCDISANSSQLTNAFMFIKIIAIVHESIALSFVKDLELREVLLKDKDNFYHIAELCKIHEALALFVLQDKALLDVMINSNGLYASITDILSHKKAFLVFFRNLELRRVFLSCNFPPSALHSSIFQRALEFNVFSLSEEEEQLLGRPCEDLINYVIQQLLNRHTLKENNINLRIN